MQGTVLQQTQGVRGIGFSQNFQSASAFYTQVAWKKKRDQPTKNADGRGKTENEERGTTKGIFRKNNPRAQVYLCACLVWTHSFCGVRICLNKPQQEQIN